MEAPLGTYAHRSHADQSEPAKGEAPHSSASRRSRSTNVRSLIELMKAARSNWLPLAEVMDVTDMARNSARGWLAEMVSQGVLVMKKGPRGGHLYRLSEAWFGKGTTPLTDAEVLELMPSNVPANISNDLLWFARALERAHGIGAQP